MATLSEGTPRVPEESADDRATTMPPAPPPIYTTLTVGRVMAFTAAALFVIFVANVLLRVTDVLILGLVGVLLATAINPLARRLQTIGLKRSASILSVYLLILLAIGGLIAFVIPPLVTQGTDFVNHIPAYTKTFQDRFKDSDQVWLRELVGQIAAQLNGLYDRPPDVVNLARGYAGNVVARVFGSLISIVTVILISFYWLAERNLIRRSLLSFVPEKNRERVGSVWDHIEGKLGAWFRAQLTLCAIIGVTSAVCYGVLDLTYWPLLAFIAGVTEIIPILGPWIGGVPAVFIALLDSPVKAIIVAIFIIILQQVEGNVLVPRIQGDAIGLSPLTVILAILGGTALAGPVGGLLAVPIAAIIQVLVQDLVIARYTPDTEDLQPALSSGSRRVARGQPPVPPDARPTGGVFRQVRDLSRSRTIHRPRAEPEAPQGPSDGD